MLAGTGKLTTEQFCPYCCESADNDAFRREEDLETVRAVGMESLKQHAQLWVHDELAKALQTGFRGSGITFTRGTRPHPPSPPQTARYADLDLETEVTCDGCGLTFRVYGVFGRCPDCADINAFVVLDADLAMSEKRVVMSRRAVAEGDAAMAEEFLWDALAGVVSGFDAFGKELRRHHPTVLPAKPQNLFQNLATLDDALIAAFGQGLSTIAGSHFDALVLGFQVRHLGQHSHRVVDDAFVAKTGLRPELKGRKYPLTPEEAQRAIDAVRHVVGALRAMLTPRLP